MSKILIIGSDGQLAFDLIKVFAKDNEIFKASHKNLDITEEGKVLAFMQRRKPEVVINTAAFHKVALCEQDPELSYKVNAIGAHNVAKSAYSVGAIVVYISTNYVFDGTNLKKKGYIETDQTNPLNIYGASKLSGECLTLLKNPRAYIVRTSGLFGVHRSGKGHNFVSLMLEKARKGEEIKVVDDEITSVTGSFDLALKIKELLKTKAPFGIYHIVNSGGCSWYKFAKEIFRQKKINVNLKLIKTSDKIPEGFQRPLFSVLDSANLRKAGLTKLRSWKDALKYYLKQVN